MNTWLNESPPPSSAKAWTAKLARPRLTDAPLFVPRKRRPLRILYVDGDPQIRTLGKLVLLRAGYQVHSVAHGAAAWIALHQESYDLLIADHELPGMTGLELIAHVRQAEMKLSIMLTFASFDTTWRENWEQLKISSFLAKPYAVDSLLGAVGEILHFGKTLLPGPGLPTPKSRFSSPPQPNRPAAAVRTNKPETKKTIMARLIPLYSTSSQAEIEKRAQKLFEQKGRHSGHRLDCWRQAEADFLEQTRIGPMPTYFAPVGKSPTA